MHKGLVSQAFSPVKVDGINISSAGIGGVSRRFIREEGKRAKPLVSRILLFVQCSRHVTSITN